jgi:hypothetical protein
MRWWRQTRRVMLVEKVSYQINWKRFRKGYSIFIPCLNPPVAKREILRTLNRLRYKVLMKVVIEEGVQGVRVWRL